MSMRCLSTGGGEFSGVGNVYVEYVAAFSMLLACGNFLLYFRLIHTLTPHFNTPPQEFKRNLIANIKTFYSNSEVQFMSAVIVVGTLLIAFTIFDKNYITDGNTGFRMALFHVVSFASTTGMTLRDISNAPDFDRFFLFLLVAMGGCMGSVTGGLKVIRVLILFKIAAVDIHKTIHPRMMPSITVNGSVVPIRVVGRILSYFFLCVLTLFVCSVLCNVRRYDARLFDQRRHYAGALRFLDIHAVTDYHEIVLRLDFRRRAHGNFRFPNRTFVRQIPPRKNSLALRGNCIE